MSIQVISTLDGPLEVKTEEEPKQTQVTPFSIINDLGRAKQMTFEEAEKQFSPYLTNKSFGFYYDTIMYANEMNRSPHLPKSMQFEFYRTGVRPKSRFGGWKKAPKSPENMTLIMEYYKYSESKALAALAILTEEQIDIIRHKMNRGGRGGKS